MIVQSCFSFIPNEKQVKHKLDDKLKCNYRTFGEYLFNFHACNMDIDLNVLFFAKGVSQLKSILFDQFNNSGRVILIY